MFIFANTIKNIYKYFQEGHLSKQVHNEALYKVYHIPKHGYFLSFNRSYYH